MVWLWTLLIVTVAAGGFLAVKSASASGLPRLHRSVHEAVEPWRSIAEREVYGYPRLYVSLILGVIARESAGDASAIGPSGERGLMQMTEAAWTDYKREHPSDPDCLDYDSQWTPTCSIRAGSWFLARKIEEMGNTFDGLRAYNRGTVGASRDKNAGADYARWILDVGEPAFRSIA